MIDFLVSQMVLPDPVFLRPNVLLAFAEHEPTIDFSAHHLVREVNDDLVPQNHQSTAGGAV
ncbi:hypothetical protein MB02_11175 [Croceicoccus estronivorus]|uniref:hypothetical protein n=1 Tax=Croceicoccus estronivorus TaxID=1172626 RepID=UPI000829F2B1|nr:hypothetical protein [Croceicoccus estronivorus]OCC23712.1 hypothetical protein MB02_11175 [Croceicoccus estronivorus]